MHKGSQSALSLKDAERNIHLTAKSRQPHNEFDGVHIVSNDHKLCFLLLDKGGDVLEAELKDRSRGSSGSSLAIRGGLGSILNALGLGLLGLRAVLYKDLQQLGGLVLVDGVRELVDCRGNFKSLEKDLMAI